MRADVPQVSIRACGLRTCFGDLAGTWDALLSGKSIDDHVRIECASPTRRALTIARDAASQVIPAIGINPDAAIIVGTSKGTVEDWFSPAAGGLSPFGLGEIACELAREYPTSGPVLTLSAACASGLHALIRGAMMIRAGEVRQALIVASEASAHPLFIGSFQRLGVLAKPGAGCRPFDRNRNGFYVSEAACAVLLQARSAGDSPPLQRPIIVDRFALGGDATHLTGSDPDGRTLRYFLNQAAGGGTPMDLIHAHGTGTELNDSIELAAIESLTSESPAGSSTVYSHKGALGHTLGASGLLSVVLNCMAHATGVIPPNIRTTEPIATRNVEISSNAIDRPVRRSLAIASGFGGTLAGVRLVSE